jgi:hypothetical protein
MAKRGLDGRNRDTTGRIDKKHGNTRVGSLRKTYGEHFAKGRRKDMMLKPCWPKPAPSPFTPICKRSQIAGYGTDPHPLDAGCKSSTASLQLHLFSCGSQAASKAPARERCS